MEGKKGNRALKRLVILLKESAIVFVYIVIMSITSILIMAIKNAFGRIALTILNMLLLCVMCFLFEKSFGEKQYKNLITGNIRRTHKNENDIEKYCKPYDEYRPINGCLVGLISVSIMVILLIVNLCLKESANDGVTAVVILMFGVFSSIIKSLNENASIYFLFIFILVPVISCGLGYYVGGKKIELQQARLQKTHEAIYGKKIDIDEKVNRDINSKKINNNSSGNGENK